MGTEKLAVKVRAFAEEVTSEAGFELVHVEITSLKSKRIVRIFIDKDDGITHEDCAFVSREVEKLLDDDDPISGGYLLEVSSPGIERGLYSLKDFERFSGNEARVKTSDSVNGQTNFRGKIVGVTGDTIQIEDLTSGSVNIRYDFVKKANLTIDVARELQDSRKKYKRAR